MIRRAHEAMMVGVLLAGSLVIPEGAQAKDGKPAKAASPASHAAGAEVKGKAKAAADKAEPGPKGHPASGGPAGPGPERALAHAERAEFKSAVAELRERQAQGKLSKDELKKELAALRETRKERRQQHGEALKARWGNQLAQPAMQQELRHHEQRMAKLERMSLLAESERKGEAKSKLVARIQKLTEQENERHERKMKVLQAHPGITRPASAVEPGSPSGKTTAAAPGSEKAEKEVAQ